MLLLLVTNTPAVQHRLLQAGKSSQLDKSLVTLTRVQGVCAFLLFQPGTFGEVRAAMYEKLLWTEPQSLLLSVPARPLTGESGQSYKIVGPHLSCFTTD